VIFFVFHEQNRDGRCRRERRRITKKAAQAALEALIDIITADLKKGHNVVLNGFGIFRVSKRAARTGVNPLDLKEKIKIPALKVATFKAGKALKEAVR
jgi:nucleoid DNA-binding protein